MVNLRPQCKISYMSWLLNQDKTTKNIYHFSNILNTAPVTHWTISSPSKRCTSQAQKHIKWRTYTFLSDRLNNDRISWQRLKLTILELRHTRPVPTIQLQYCAITAKRLCCVHMYLCVLNSGRLRRLSRTVCRRGAPHRTAWKTKPKPKRRLHFKFITINYGYEIG